VVVVSSTVHNFCPPGPRPTALGPGPNGLSRSPLGPWLGRTSWSYRLGAGPSVLAVREPPKPKPGMVPPSRELRPPPAGRRPSQLVAWRRGESSKRFLAWLPGARSTRVEASVLAVPFSVQGNKVVLCTPTVF
jgi:hypothetical protein